MQQPGPAPDRAVYGISVAAELVGMGPQTLRLYESRGLLAPDRSVGGTRRYSEFDLNRLRRIGELIDEGLNLAGVAAVLGLEAENAVLRAENLEHQSANPPLGRTLRPSDQKRGRPTSAHRPNSAPGRASRAD
jgi:MerR family transcriptional regulator/heat shock protein HspR